MKLPSAVLAIVLVVLLVWSGEGSNAILTDEKRFEDAAMYAEEAKLNEEEGDVAQALPFYRAAVRLLPNFPEYLIMLGKAEYQLGMFRQAHKRFQKVLSVDEGSAVAQYFLKQSESGMEFAGRDDNVISVENAEYVALPEYPLSAIMCNSLTEACAHSAVQHEQLFARPFIVRGFLQSGGFNFDAFSLASLNETYGLLHVVDFYPQNMLLKPTKVYSVPLWKALNYLDYPEGAYLSVDASEPGTYIQWNLNETVWDGLLQRGGLQHTLPSYLAGSLDAVFGGAQGVPIEVHGTEGDRGAAEVMERARSRLARLSSGEGARIKRHFSFKTHWYMLLIGEAGAGMFPHKDTLPVGSWQAQVVGAKRWRLCSPESHVMDPYTDEHDAHGADDGSDPGVCYETTLHQGDLIYYPPDYWHQTLALDTPTISLSGTLAIHEHGEFLRSLQHECRTYEKGFDFEPAFCDLIL